MSRDQLIFDGIFEGQIFGPRSNLTLRKWQNECLHHYLQSVGNQAPLHQHQYCVFAGPGSGKTKMAALVAAHLLNTRAIDQVVVVCPNRSILHKTRKDFLKFFGIDLVAFRTQDTGGVGRMRQGYITTYQNLARNPSLHGTLNSPRYSRTLVIFDEVHHLGDGQGNAWGEAALEAFGAVPFVLSLSGTPYRSDNKRIPFVRYEPQEKNGRFEFAPDFSYPLGRAVAERACRKPIFHLCDGKVKIRWHPDSPPELVTFKDSLTQDMSAERLRGAVRNGSETRNNILADALDFCREQGLKAIIFLGGDTEAKDTPTEDANVYLPDRLHELGYGPEDYEVIVSDNKDAQHKIDSFGASDKWILVSINMVSEGVDIPELSAAIFLSSVTAKQTTVQRIGRVLRRMGEDDPRSCAHIWMFEDPGLVELAGEIEGEIRHEINVLRKTHDRSPSDPGADPAEKHYRPESIGIEGGHVVFHEYGGMKFTPDEVEDAKSQLRSKGMPAYLEHALVILAMEKSSEPSLV